MIELTELDLIESLTGKSKSFLEKTEKGERVVFEECLWDDEIGISGLTITIEVHFLNCQFSRDVGFYSSQFEKGVFFDETEIVKDLSFYNCHLHESLTLENTLVKGDFDIQQCGSLGTLSIEESGVNGKLWIYTNHIKELDFHDSAFKGKAELINNRIESLSFSELEVASMDVSQSIIKELNLEERLYDCSINFDNDQIQDISISDFTSTSSNKLIFNSLKPCSLDNPTIEISQSDLGNLMLVDCELLNYSISFKNSNLAGLTSIETHWPNKIQTWEGNGETLRLYETRDIYRQLKLAMANQGDRVQELKFKALEMETYYHSLRWKKDWWDKLVLGISYHSNYFGLKWEWALGWLLTFSLIFFFLTLSFNGSIGWENVKYYFSSLNPAHSFDYIGGKELNFCAATTDFFGRILNSFFIFQFIRAFRKYAG